ncbi:MAG: hypothetical protein ACOYYS_10630 [Chloroflexota bacterium]
MTAPLFNYQSSTDRARFSLSKTKMNSINRKKAFRRYLNSLDGKELNIVEDVLIFYLARSGQYGGKPLAVFRGAYWWLCFKANMPHELPILFLAVALAALILAQGH